LEDVASKFKSEYLDNSPYGKDILSKFTKLLEKSIHDFNVLEFFVLSNKSNIGIFAYSEYRVGSYIYDAYRLMERSFKYLFNGILEHGGVYLFGKKGTEDRRLILFLNQHEDPRIFRFKMSVYLYTHLYDPKIGNNSIVITKLGKKVHKSYSLKIKNRINGKNWVPLEFNNRLYFLYSLDPPTFVAMPKLWLRNLIYLRPVKNSILPIWKWDDNNLNFSWTYRGGSPAIEYGRKFYLAGHRFYSHDSHSLFLMEIDLKSKVYKILELTEYRAPLLIDPFSLSITEKNFVVGMSLSAKNSLDEQEKIYSVLIEINTQKILNEFSEKDALKFSASF
jgi:hypothetical protein